MSDKLYSYYERELLFIRQMAQEFARRYPATAGRLMLEPNRSADPHVERLLEGFALLAGRVQNKIDDEFPELTDALLSVLYPHYLAPIPSMAILCFELDSSRLETPTGFRIERGAKLRTQPVNDVICKFRTSYPVTLWPVTLTSARMIARPLPPQLNPPPGCISVIRLQLETNGVDLANLTSLDSLRFYLHGDNHLVGQLYELLFNHTIQVVFRSLDKEGKAQTVTLAADDAIRPVGFGPDEGMLPYPPNSFVGYRLLTEFFAFRNKFLFFDLHGFDRIRRAGHHKKVEVLFFLNRTISNLEPSLDASFFRLGCAPVINLFEQTAEPIPLTHTRFDYRVVPDVAHPTGMEVYSVDSVSGTDPTTGKATPYHPFYSYRHGGTRDSHKTFWHTSRRASLLVNDRGTEVYISLADLAFHPARVAGSTLVVWTTCTNRDLPSRLKLSGSGVRFELEAAAPLSRIECLKSPTDTLRPPLRRGAQWRLISHISLNHLSISGAAGGRESLQEILRLYDFTDPETDRQFAAVTRDLIDGIAAVQSRRVVNRAVSDGFVGLRRGVEVTLDFDEQKYVGTGMYLFACVLERFLGLYVSINSFSQLVARTKGSEQPFRRWPPRAGEQPLL